MEGLKLENLEENPRSKDENQQQTQPTYDTGPELNPGHIGGRRALSLLRHPFSPWNKSVCLSILRELLNLLNPFVWMSRTPIKSLYSVCLL